MFYFRHVATFGVYFNRLYSYRISLADGAATLARDQVTGGLKSTTNCLVQLRVREG